MYPYHNPMGSQPAEAPAQLPQQPDRAHNLSRIGMPILFASGPYAGQTIRAEIVEIQKPDLGRKFAKRDRRPLDPPPVVRLRMFQVFNADTEQEIPPDQVEVGGLVCHVDLYAIRPTPYPHLRAVNQNGDAPGGPPTFDQATLVTPMPPSEDSKVTDSLFGTTFSVASQIKGLDGDEVIFYVFSDLSVRTEGLFILRYRMFDIFSRMEGSEDIPVLAECHGGPFAIYSTKEFPGLRASTELTKHLSRYGIRVNLREAERKRKPVGPAGANSNSNLGVNVASPGSATSLKIKEKEETRDEVMQEAVDPDLEEEVT